MYKFSLFINFEDNKIAKFNDVKGDAEIYIEVESKNSSNQWSRIREEIVQYMMISIKGLVADYNEILSTLYTEYLGRYVEEGIRIVNIGLR